MRRHGPVLTKSTRAQRSVAESNHCIAAKVVCNGMIKHAKAGLPSSAMLSNAAMALAPCLRFIELPDHYLDTAHANGEIALWPRTADK